MQDKIYFIIYFVYIWQFVTALLTKIFIAKFITTSITAEAMLLAKHIIDLVGICISFSYLTAAKSTKYSAIMFAS